MNAASDAIATPPPVPAPPARKPPGLGEAIGLLVLYFGLIATLANFLLALVLGMRSTQKQAGGVSDMIRSAMSSPDARTGVVTVTLMLASALTLWLARKRWPVQWRQPSAADGIGFVKPSQESFYAAAVVLGLASPILGGLLTQWLAQGHPVPQDITRMGQTASMSMRLALALAAVTLGPLVEETMFRGVLLSALLGFRRRLPRSASTDDRWRTVIAVALSAGLFGLVHLPDLGYLWYAVPNLMLLGVATAWLRLNSGSLWPAVLAHSVNNLLAVAGWFAMAHTPG